MYKIKSFFNEESRFNIKDLFILTIIVLFYTFLSFYNLGTKVAPQTFYDINGTGLKITLEKKEFVNQIMFYTGENSGYYNFEISTDGKNYSNNIILNADGCFKWKKGNVSSYAKYIRLVPRRGNSLSLGELALYDNAGNKIPMKITANAEKVYALNDESSTIPLDESYINSTYFDEVYYARTSYNYLKNQNVYEWTHPPLGKLIQYIPVLITKEFTPFNYRLMGNIAGIIMIIVMYLFGKALFRKRKYATLSALLMTFDNFHFTMSRIGTADIYLTLFILLSIYFMFLYIKKDGKVWQLLLSGIFIGCAIATKWTGLFAGLALAIIYFADKIITKKKLVPFLLYGFSFFIIIPILIYGASYLVLPYSNRINDKGIKGIVEINNQMYNYHKGVQDDHPFSSKWYSWPISYKPVWLYTSDVRNNHKETIVAIGNIMIWWPAILTFFLLPYFIVKKKNKKSAFLLVCILSMYIPYIFIGRVMFLYHYFIILPFMMLTIVNFFYQVNKTGKRDILMFLYLCAVILTFTIYYPVSSGKNVSTNYIDSTKVLDSWTY